MAEVIDIPNSVENHHLIWRYTSDLRAILGLIIERPWGSGELEVSEKIAGLRAILADAQEKLDATERRML